MALPAYYLEKSCSGRQKARIRLIGLETCHTLQEVKQLVERGSRFMLFRYTFFLVFLYWNRTSPIYLIKDRHDARYKKSRQLYCLLCAGIFILTLLIFIPGLQVFSLFNPDRGFSYNAVILLIIGLGLFIPLTALWRNLHGGEDVTARVLAFLEAYDTAGSTEHGEKQWAG